jgi:phenylacetic acid degradation operon negative regulatory protein
MLPSARSLILDLLSTLRRGSMPVRALIDAGSLFSFSENNVRVNLARLRRTGLVERDERGRYRLGTAAAAVDDHVTSWRRAPARLREWAGSWVAVHGGRSAAERRTRGDARSMLGFRELEPGLAVRPDNLTGGVAELRSALERLRPGEDFTIFGVRELDARRDRAARALWDGAALERDYATLQSDLEASERELSALDRDAAMVRSFLVGGAAIRCVALDPLLPPPIVARGALSQLVGTLRSYDAAGRACWADFLRSHGVTLSRAKAAPADRRAGGLAAAVSPVLASEPAPLEGAA